MRSALLAVMVGAPVVVLIALGGCSDEGPTADPLGDSGGKMDGGAFLKDGGSSDPCVAFLETLDGGSPAGGAGAAIVGCTPHGVYDAKVTNKGTCTGGSFPEGTTTQSLSFPDPATQPYPAVDNFANCTPPVSNFSEGSCSVYVPQGTSCASTSFPLEIHRCSYFWCDATADNCKVFIGAKLNPGTDQECTIDQLLVMTRPK